MHFIVGTNENSQIDHKHDKLTIPMPKGWIGKYDPQIGEIIFSSRDTPLTPATPYMVKIRTETMYKIPPGDMGWYWTDKDGKKIGDAQVIEGPVFPK